MDEKLKRTKIYKEMDEKLAGRVGKKLPLWVHGILKFGLQAVLGYLTYYNFIYENYIWTFLCGFLFCYFLVFLLFGAKIREWILEEIFTK